MVLSGRHLPAALLALPVLLVTNLPAQDPWARATLPASCYAADDNYGEALTTAQNELSAERDRRRAANKALSDQIFALEPAALQQRLMAAVQKNPSRAQEIMAVMQQQGQTNATEATETSREQIAFDKRREMLVQTYKTELDAVMSPIVARIQKHTVGKGQTAADTKIVQESVAEANTKYETVHCVKMWKKDAPGLMQEFKQYLIGTRIPKEAAGEASSKGTLDLFGVPSREFQPTAEIDAVVTYLRFAGDLYRARQGAPATVK